jgi:mRNA interferase MazF
MKFNPKPGEVYVVDLGLTVKVRPAVVLSRYDPDRPLSVISFASITSQHRNSVYEIALGKLPFLKEESWINVQSVSSIQLNRLIKLLGKLNEQQMRIGNSYFSDAKIGAEE